MERKQCFADLGEHNIQGNLHVYIEEEEKNKITLEFNHITTQWMQQCMHRPILGKDKHPCIDTCEG